MQMMCDMLEVSRSGYYAWLDRPVGARQARKERVIEQIEKVFTVHREL